MSGFDSTLWIAFDNNFDIRFKLNLFIDSFLFSFCKKHQIYKWLGKQVQYGFKRKFVVKLVIHSFYLAGFLAPKESQHQFIL